MSLKRACRNWLIPWPKCFRGSVKKVVMAIVIAFRDREIIHYHTASYKSRKKATFYTV